MKADISSREGLFAVMRQLAREREEAKPRVAELLARKELPWDEPIPEEWRTAGFVRELTKEAYAAPENDPEHAVMSLYFALAATTAVRGYPEVIRGMLEASLFSAVGWIETYCDEYQTAEKALNRAAQYAEGDAALAHERGAVLQNQATLAVAKHDFQETLELLGKAEAVFTELHDTNRLARIQVIRAICHHRRGELHIAEKQLESAIELLENSPDIDTLACFYTDLATLRADNGEVSRAVEAAKKARELYTSIHIPSLRPDWVEARAILNAGRFEEALARLHEVRNAFLLRGLLETAAVVGLDIVETLVAKGEASAAREFTEQIIEEFATTHAYQQIQVALSYLRELLPKSDKPRAIARHVRAYVSSASDGSRRLFLPLENEES